MALRYKVIVGQESRSEKVRIIGTIHFSECGERRRRRAGEIVDDSLHY